MRKITLLFLIALVVLGSCKKSGSGGNTTSEVQLQIALDPDPGTAIAYAPTGQYSFNVKVTSSLPTSGVMVALKTVKDSDNSTLDSKSVQATTTTIPLTTGDVLAGVTYTVTVTVVSNSKSSNTATKSFKLTRK
ncbi:MAG: hypothetical protein ACO29O_07120 [Chitinophagaceae bacterium]